MVSVQEFDQIDEASRALEQSTLSFLKDIVRIPSTNPPGEYDEIHTGLTTFFTNFGWDVETLRAPDELLTDLDIAFPRPNILAYASRGDGPTIALRSHFDTVPVDSAEWTFDPFGGEVDGDRLYGRGTTDEKGQIASHVLAIRILEETDLLPEDVTIVLICDTDEETDGKAGAGFVADNKHVRPDYLLGQGVIDEIWNSGLGFIQYRVEVHGTSSHAGVNPDNSANSLIGAARLIRCIEEYSAADLRDPNSSVEMGAPTTTPTALSSNDNLSVIPAKTTFYIDQRYPPGFSTDELRDDLIQTIEATTLPANTTATVTVIDSADPYYHDPDEDHVSILHHNANTYLETDVPVVGTRSSGNRDPDPRWAYRPPKTHYYASNGARCVHFGPGSISNNIHDRDEYIRMPEVRQAGAVIAASVLDLAR